MPIQRRLSWSPVSVKSYFATPVYGLYDKMVTMARNVGDRR